MRTRSIQLALLVGAAAIWEGISRAVPAVTFAAASPSQIAAALIALARGEVWIHIYYTAGEAILGFLLGTMGGSLIGLSLWFRPNAAKAARPFVVVFAAIPIFVFAPILILVFGVGAGMKVAAATIATFFVALGQAYHGAQSLTDGQLQLVHAMRSPQRRIFTKLVIPSAVDWVLNSMRLNAGFALLGAFIGEVISSDRGLGYLMMRASGLYDMPRAFAAAFVLASLALVLDQSAAIVETHRHGLVQLLSVPAKVRRHGAASRSLDREQDE